MGKLSGAHPVSFYRSVVWWLHSHAAFNRQEVSLDITRLVLWASALPDYLPYNLPMLPLTVILPGRQWQLLSTSHPCLDATHKMKENWLRLTLRAGVKHDNAYTFAVDGSFDLAPTAVPPRRNTLGIRRLFFARMTPVAGGQTGCSPEISGQTGNQPPSIHQARPNQRALL